MTLKYWRSLAVAAIILWTIEICSGFVLGALGGLFGGSRPLPGDILSPESCEKFCRQQCLSGGFSGGVNIPGCNRFCDCDYYIRPPFYNYNYFY